MPQLAFLTRWRWYSWLPWWSWCCVCWWQWRHTSSHAPWAHHSWSLPSPQSPPQWPWKGSRDEHEDECDVTTTPLRRHPHICKSYTNGSPRASWLLGHTALNIKKSGRGTNKSCYQSNSLRGKQDFLVLLAQINANGSGEFHLKKNSLHFLSILVLWSWLSERGQGHPSSLATPTNPSYSTHDHHLWSHLSIQHNVHIAIILGHTSPLYHTMYTSPSSLATPALHTTPCTHSHHPWSHLPFISHHVHTAIILGHIYPSYHTMYT